MLTGLLSSHITVIKGISTFILQQYIKTICTSMYIVHVDTLHFTQNKREG